MGFMARRGNRRLEGEMYLKEQIYGLEGKSISRGKSTAWGVIYGFGAIIYTALEGAIYGLKAV
jgi:hypothetical protein